MSTWRASAGPVIAPELGKQIVEGVGKMAANDCTGKLEHDTTLGELRVTRPHGEGKAQTAPAKASGVRLHK